MTPEQLAAILVSITGVLGGIAVVLRAIGELRKDLNGRLEQLLVAAADAARKDGELAGRDYAHRQAQKIPDPNEQGSGISTNS